MKLFRGWCKSKYPLHGVNILFYSLHEVHISLFLRPVHTKQIARQSSCATCMHILCYCCFVLFYFGRCYFGLVYNLCFTILLLFLSLHKKKIRIQPTHLHTHANLCHFCFVFYIILDEGVWVYNICFIIPLLSIKMNIYLSYFYCTVL